MRPRGFTLLEMVVVLAILGLASALVAPSMLRGIDSWRRQAAMDALFDQIRALPGRARAGGQDILIEAGGLTAVNPPLSIEGDWTLSVEQPWKVRANGICEGGTIAVANAYGTRRIRIAPPFCDPVVE